MWATTAAASTCPLRTAPRSTACAARCAASCSWSAGRPQLVTDQLGAIDSLVASWLPGSEGAGVADTLFGDVPFTGRLPISWPATAAQLPVNVGDAVYEPAYAYGWGLRTDSQRARLERAAAGPTARPGGSARGARRRRVVGEAIAPGAEARAVRLLVAASALLDGTGDQKLVEAGLVVSVVRDLAQAAVVAGGPGLVAASSSLTADAEHELMAGRAGASASLLAQVAGVGLIESTTTLRLSHGRAVFGEPATALVRVSAPRVRRRARSRSRRTA